MWHTSHRRDRAEAHPPHRTTGGPDGSKALLFLHSPPHTAGSCTTGSTSNMLSRAQVKAMLAAEEPAAKRAKPQTAVAGGAAHQITAQASARMLLSRQAVKGLLQGATERAQPTSSLTQPVNDIHELSKAWGQPAAQAAHALYDTLMQDTSPMALKPHDTGYMRSMCAAYVDCLHDAYAQSTNRNDTYSWRKWNGTVQAWRLQH